MSGFTLSKKNYYSIPEVIVIKTTIKYENRNDKSKHN